MPKRLHDNEHSFPPSPNPSPSSLNSSTSASTSKRRRLDTQSSIQEPKPTSQQLRLSNLCEDGEEEDEVEQDNPASPLSIKAHSTSLSRYPARSTTLNSTSPTPTSNLRDHKPRPNGLAIDRLTSLPTELLIRILHLLPFETVLLVQLISKKLGGLAKDPQIWKVLYWSRWVRPRVRRAGKGRDHGKWLDESWLVRPSGAETEAENNKIRGEGNDTRRAESGSGRKRRGKQTDWKARYKLRHNWSIGAAEVKEIGLGFGVGREIQEDEDEEEAGQRCLEGKTLLARLVDGVVVTVDVKQGLRAWDLKSKECIAQGTLLEDGERSNASNSLVPACLAVDSNSGGNKGTGVVVGYRDGHFEVWRLIITGGEGSFERQYRSKVPAGQASGRELSAVTYAHPYLLTITTQQLLSIHVFDSGIPLPISADVDLDTGTTTLISTSLPYGDDPATSDIPTQQAPQTSRSLSPPPTTSSPNVKPGQEPRLLTTLKSHTCFPPLSLSIRSSPNVVIATIAYTLPTYLAGWSVGIQELHLEPATGTVTCSRLAFAVGQGFRSVVEPSAGSSAAGKPSSLSASPTLTNSLSFTSPRFDPVAARRTRVGQMRAMGLAGPTSLSYSHPYLVTSNRDNTLSLYLVNSTPDSLSISAKSLLHGHTSSVSGAQVQARGKAVSISGKGGELRVWELEGSGAGKGSVRVGREGSNLRETQPVRNLAEGVEQRGWVGFDDEVVIVLSENEGRGGEEKLVVYDFT